MKAVRFAAVGVIAVSSAFGAVDIADRVDRIGEECANTVSVSGLLLWAWQENVTLSYEKGVWYDDRENHVLGTSPVEDADVCLVM